MSNKFRSHNCNEIDKKLINQTVKLSGWVHSKRDHGSLIFIDLRDHYGITQIVIDQQNKNLNLDLIASIKLESVITIEGLVVLRSHDAINSKINTGEIEIKVDNLSIESLSEQIPFQVNSDLENYPEELRLKYRFLDLRRDKVHKNIILRSQVISALRVAMTNQGFLEIQTPILTASSP